MSSETGWAGARSSCSGLGDGVGLGSLRARERSCMRYSVQQESFRFCFTGRHVPGNEQRGLESWKAVLWGTFPNICEKGEPFPCSEGLKSIPSFPHISNPLRQ